MAEEEKQPKPIDTNLSRLKQEREDVGMLKKNMNNLTALYREHRNRHPQMAVSTGAPSGETARLQIQSFRRAIGTLLSVAPQNELNPGRNVQEQDRQAASDLQALLVGGDLHLDVVDDPVNDLEKLITLESVINDFKKLEIRSENWTLCDRARLALSLSAPVRLGDTLTQSFRPYTVLAEYTSLQEPLKFAPEYGLHSYEKIQKFVGAPFKPRTISDLNRLTTFVDSVADQTMADTQSPNITIPLIDMKIDRMIILVATPIFLLVLFRLMAYYAKRSSELVNKISDVVANASPKPGYKADYQRCAPHILSPLWFLFFSVPIVTPLIFVLNRLIMAQWVFEPLKFGIHIIIGLAYMFIMLKKLILIRRLLILA